MELFAGKMFSVEKIEVEITAAERRSIIAKSNATSDSIFECPKIGCGGIMSKVESDDYLCSECGSSYSTFKWRGKVEGLKRSKDDSEEDESKEDTSKKDESADSNGSTNNEAATPKRRCLRNNKAI